MKHIKLINRVDIQTKFELFEELNINEPKIGDYVICQAKQDVDDILKNFLLTAIGNIRDISARSIYNYGVYFEDIPNDVVNNWDNPIDFMKEEIIYWSENKEELEMIVQAKKYNL